MYNNWKFKRNRKLFYIIGTKFLIARCERGLDGKNSHEKLIRHFLNYRVRMSDIWRVENVLLVLIIRHVVQGIFTIFALALKLFYTTLKLEPAAPIFLFLTCHYQFLIFFYIIRWAEPSTVSLSWCETDPPCHSGPV